MYIHKSLHVFFFKYVINKFKKFFFFCCPETITHLERLRPSSSKHRHTCRGFLCRTERRGNKKELSPRTPFTDKLPKKTKTKHTSDLKLIQTGRRVFNCAHDRAYEVLVSVHVLA